MPEAGLFKIAAQLIDQAGEKYNSEPFFDIFQRQRDRKLTRKEIREAINGRRQVPFGLASYDKEVQEEIADIDIQGFAFLDRKTRSKVVDAKLPVNPDHDTVELYGEVYKTIRDLEYGWIAGAEQFIDGMAEKLGIEKVDVKAAAKAA